MKKRRVSVILVSMLFCLLLIGCEKTRKSNIEKTIIQSELSENSVSESNISESSEQLVTETEVTFEQLKDVTIIDDNYRNYYEVFLYSYCDSNGDGIGDIKGLINKLDYINDGDSNTMTDMGFDGIWLMPIMPSTTYHKYDVIDYYNIDPEYGTLEDFKTLAKECDKRGIKLVIDLVINHTSTQNKWFVEATNYLESLEANQEPDSTECPYVDYYHFKKGKPTTGTYYQVGSSDWYYEAVFWDQMPDLALENKVVRDEIEKVADYWLSLGVDGFRIDAAKEFFSGENSKNIEVLNWFQTYVTTVNKDTYVVAEVWDSFETIGDYYQSDITSMFNFAVAEQDGKIAKTINKTGATSTALSFAEAMVTIQDSFSKNNSDFIDAPFISNHDMGRMAGYFAYDENKIKMAAGLLMMMNGSPFVYYGEEIGTSSIGSLDESKRIPMFWSSTNEDGMTDGPVGMEVVEPKFKSVEEQLVDKNSILTYYKKAIRLRNENPEIARGIVSVITELSGTDICAVSKVYNGSEIIIVYNISETASQVDLSSTVTNEWKLQGQLASNSADEITYEKFMLAMPAYSIAILKQ